MNDLQRKLYQTPSFFSNPINHLQQIWTLVLSDFNSVGMSFQRACLLSAFTIELLHHARSLPQESKTQRDEIGRFLQWYPHIFMKTQGGYLNHLLGQSIVNELMMTNGNISEYQKFLETRITFMLAEWVETHKVLKKNKEDKVDTDTWATLNTFLNKPHYDNIYDKLLFIEFIKTDLVALETDWATVNDRDLNHVDSVARFLTSLIPKVLFNVLVQAQYFPKAMTEKNPQEVYDILYLNENKHTELAKRIQFLQLVTILLQNLLRHLEKLSEKEQSGLLNIVFNYFYAYHAQFFQQCSRFLITIFEKLPSVIRYAKFNDIMLFLTVLEKLQYTAFIKQLFEKFKWIQESKEKIQNAPAHPRNAIDLFLNQQKLIVVPASQVVIQLVQILRPYSLVYFDISCKAADIDVNLYYSGSFNESHQLKKLVFEKKRLKAKQQFRGSIEAVQPGLYYLELNNSYSWMTAKTVGYKLQIIVPMDIEYPYESNPYSRFLLSQLSRKIPYQLTIDYNFFERKEGIHNEQCQIRVSQNNYIVTVGTYTYELETENPKSALTKIGFKLESLRKTLNIQNYSINGKQYFGSNIEEIMKGIRTVLQKLQQQDIPSPVELLKDVQSNRQSLEQRNAMSVVKEIDSAPQSQIKESENYVQLAQQKANKISEQKGENQQIKHAEEAIQVKQTQNLQNNAALQVQTIQKNVETTEIDEQNLQ